MRDAARRILDFDGASPWSWATWAGRALLALGIVAPAFLPFGEPFVRLMLAVVAFLGLAGALLIGALPTHDGRNLRIVEAGWSLMFLLHFSGHAWDLYDRILHYDKLSHALGGVIAGVAAFELAQGTSWFWNDARPFRAFFVVVATVALAGVTLELIEFSADQMLGTRSQTHPVLDPLDDTMLDLAAELATGLLTGIAVAVHVGRSPSRAAGPTSPRTRRMQEDT